MKKQKHFYSHIIETSTLSLALGDVEMTQEQRIHLLSLVESNLHHEILDVALSELSDEDKKRFLDHLIADEHDKIWELLNNKVDDVEEKIKQVAAAVVKELHKDVKEAKRS
jgi:hypothetical protein